jgi:hypothetical protein
MTANPAVERTLREKPRKAAHFERWASVVTYIANLS